MTIVKVEKNTYTVDALYQWDNDQDLVIYGLSLPMIPEIHFTNDAMDKAIVKQSTMNDAGIITARIPNSLLQKPYKIKAYVCIYEGDTFKSLYSIEIPIKARKKPADYTIENDEEIYSFNALENLVNNHSNNKNNPHNVTAGQLGLENVDNTSDINKPISTATRTALNEIGDIAESALTIAKGKNRAHVFATTEDLNAWLSDEANAGKYQIGDNLYIVETEVQDWWISEVLTEADADTGFYYKIAQLETQKVDLSEIEEDIEALQAENETLRGQIDGVTAVQFESVDLISWYGGETNKWSGGYAIPTSKRLIEVAVHDGSNVVRNSVLVSVNVAKRCTSSNPYKIYNFGDITTAVGQFYINSNNQLLVYNHPGYFISARY